MRHFIQQIVLTLVLCSLSIFAYSMTSDTHVSGYSFHLVIFYLCCGIALLVFGSLIYSSITFRHSKQPADHFHQRLSTELFWTVLPFIIVVALAYPAAMALLDKL